MAVIDLKHDGRQSVPLQRYEEDKYSQALEGHIDGNHTKTECTSSTNTTTGMVLIMPMFDRIRQAATSFYRFITHLLCEHFCHGKEKARVCHIWPGKNVRSSLLFLYGDYYCVVLVHSEFGLFMSVHGYGA